MSSIKLKKGDMVKVISGKASGPNGQGRIKQVMAQEKRVIIEGVNMAKKHMKPGRQNEKGGIVDMEMPVHISNVMLVNKSNEPVKMKKIVENGKRVRVEKKSGKSID